MSWLRKRRMRRANNASSARAPRQENTRAAFALAAVVGVFLSTWAHAQLPSTNAAATPPVVIAVASNVFDKSPGDTPLRQMLNALGRERETSLVVYNGNLKSDAEPCHDAFYESRRQVFDTSRKPVVMLPGDNDWTTCGQARAGGYDPIERLDFMRQTFMPDGHALGQADMSLIRESDVARFRPFRENVRWQSGNVAFAGLNAPAPNNHFLSAGGRNGEFEDRSVANTFWLEHVAESARRSDKRALVIFMQGDPDFSRYERRDRFAWLRFSRSEEKRDGFLELKRSLVKIAESFRGPVIVIHNSGGTLPTGFRIDQPLHNDKGIVVANLTRIEIGLKKPHSQWLEVAADFAWRVPFRVRVRDVVAGPATAGATSASAPAASSQPLSVEDGAPGPSSFFQEMQPASSAPASAGSAASVPAPSSDATPVAPPMLNPPPHLPPILPSTPTVDPASAP
jgi:hypothetical protein